MKTEKGIFDELFAELYRTRKQLESERIAEFWDRYLQEHGRDKYMAARYGLGLEEENDGAE